MWPVVSLCLVEHCMKSMVNHGRLLSQWGRAGGRGCALSLLLSSSMPATLSATGSTGFYFQGQCVSSCPTGYDGLNGLCTTNVTSALPTNAGYHHQPSYPPSPQTATPAAPSPSAPPVFTCAAPCKTCTGPGISQCTSCADSTATLSSGTCSCPDGKFMGYASGTCRPCSSECATVG